VGEKLKDLREKLGMSQEELSAKSGVSRVTISLIETGKTKEVLSGTIKALASALGVSVNDLFFA